MTIQQTIHSDKTDFDDSEWDTGKLGLGYDTNADYNIISTDLLTLMLKQSYHRICSNSLSSSEHCCSRQNSAFDMHMTTDVLYT